MTGDPGHDSVEIVQRFGFGRGWPIHDDDFDSERPRRLDLGVGPAPAAVLGHQRLHPLVAHKRCFVSEREGSAREDELVVGQGADLCRPVDRPHDVAMLWRSREGGELQPALREEHCPLPSPESIDRVLDCRDLDPAIACLACPGRACKDDERRVRRPAGGNRVVGHARSERMGRVDNSADPLAHQERDEAFGPPEAADALGNWRSRRIGRRSGERQDRCDIGLVGDPSRKRARLRRAAENEQAKAVQWAAP
jgi:hypothetical protein